MGRLSRFAVIRQDWDNPLQRGNDIPMFQDITAAEDHAEKLTKERGVMHGVYELTATAAPEIKWTNVRKVGK